ncbi:hypothetical protein [Salinibacter altiplanensis]|uniref:hypothetical protein n=1 Tax=Salinibacter altiplanensis TaxID=1803181 RepID=UPI000C9FA675|nr:hypothetical protein [Salinibacter altiplanensis]
MSYGTKYKVRWKDIVGRECVADVQQQGYSGAATSLLAAETAVDIEWGQQGQQDLTVPFMVSSLQLGVVGTPDAEAMLADIADTPDQEWRLKYSEDGQLFWQGFIAGDLSGANPNSPRETIEVEAIDGLALLENHDAYDDGGVISTAISRLLRGGIGYVGLHDLPVYTSMDWRPSGSVPDGKCPLDELSFQDKAYKQLDEDREPEGTLDARTNLEDVCERFGLRLFQAGGAWHLRQRDQIEDGTALKRWKMPAGQLSFNDSPTTSDVTAALPHQLKRTDRPQRRVHRLRSVESAFQYDDLGELARNGSFEDSLSTWVPANDPNAVREQYDDTPLPAAQTQEETWALHLSRALTDPSQQAKITQDVPAPIFDLGPRGSLKLTWNQVDEGGGAFACETQWQLGSHYVQARNKEVTQATNQGEDAVIYLAGSVSGLDGTILMPAGAEIPVRGGSTDTQITLSEPLQAGDERLIGELEQDVESGDGIIYWVWSDTQQTTSFGQSTSYDHFGLLNANGDYPVVPRDPAMALQPQQVTIALQTAEGIDLTGRDLQVSFESNAAFDVYIDNVSAKLQRSGEPIEETDYIAFDDHYGREVKLTHRIGSGPVKGHPRELTDDSGELLTDWTSGQGQTGLGLEQLLAQQWMRQQREALDRRTFQFEERGTQIGPQHIYGLEGTPYTVTYLTYSKSSSGNGGTIEVTEKKDAGIAGLTRAYVMDNQEAASGGSGGTIVNAGDQIIEGAGSWDELTGKPNSLLARNGDSDGFATTVALGSEDVTGALNLSGSTFLEVNSDTSPDSLVARVKDEDDMASDSATHLATQTSIKSFLENILPEGGQNIEVTGLPDPVISTVNRPTFNDVILRNQADENDEAVRADRTVEVNGTPNQVVVNAGNTTQGALTSDVSVKLQAPQNLHTGADFRVNKLRLGVANTPTKDGSAHLTGFIGHPDYTAELEHWRITAAGLGDFRTLLADELRVEAFVAEVNEALAGEDFLTKSFATLEAPFTVPGSVGNTATLHVQDLAGLGATQVFEGGDTIRMRYVDRSGGGLTVADVWVSVTGYSDQGDGTQTWTAELLESTPASGEDILEGAVALDYGVSGDFLIERSVLEPGDTGDIAPYDRILKWEDTSGNQVPDSFEVLNLRGNLSGLAKANGSGPGVYTEQGRFTSDVIVGDLEAATSATEGTYLKFTEAEGLEIVVGSGDVEAQITQNASDIELLARRVTQETESRAGLEVNVGENTASIQANATVIGDNSLFSQATLSLHASETETRFESSVQFTDNNNQVDNRASVSLLAGPGGSAAILAGENILLDGDTEVAGSFEVADANIEADYGVTLRQPDEPVDSDVSGRSLRKGDTWIDTDGGEEAYTYNGTDWARTEVDLRAQADQNSADVELLARRVAQETESRSAIELNVSENAATLTASVQYDQVANGNTSEAAIELFAGPDGSKATIVGNSILLDGDTTVTENFEVQGKVIGGLTFDGGKIKNTSEDYVIDDDGIILAADDDVFVPSSIVWKDGQTSVGSVFTTASGLLDLVGKNRVRMRIDGVGVILDCLSSQEEVRIDDRYDLTIGRFLNTFRVASGSTKVGKPWLWMRAAGGDPDDFSTAGAKLYFRKDGGGQTQLYVKADNNRIERVTNF